MSKVEGQLRMSGSSTLDFQTFDFQTHGSACHFVILFLRSGIRYGFGKTGDFESTLHPNDGVHVAIRLAYGGPATRRSAEASTPTHEWEPSVGVHASACPPQGSVLKSTIACA